MDITRLTSSTDPHPRIAVLATRRDGCSHSGIFFLDENGDPKVIDQGWHERTSHRPFQDTVIHFQDCLVLAHPAIHRISEGLLRGLCRKIARLIDTNGMRIPYAIRVSPRARFNLFSGRLELADGNGLTCCGFTTLIFKSVGVNLIDFEGWPQRDSDRDRHQELVDAMQMSGVPADHVALVQGEIDSLRASPEEVAGAALCKIPANSNTAIPAGEYVSSELNRRTN